MGNGISDGYDNYERARDLVSKYSERHPIKTRKWYSVGIGAVPQLIEGSPEEFQQVTGIVIGHDASSEVKPRTRRAIDALLESAGLEYIPVRFVTVSQPIAQ